MRFSPVAAVLLVVLLAAREDILCPLAGCRCDTLLVYATASNAWAIGYGSTAGGQRRSAVRLEAPIRRTGFRLPAHHRAPCGRAAREGDENEFRTPPPIGTWGSIFALAQGGVSIYPFVEQGDVHPVLWRPARTAIPEARLRVVALGAKRLLRYPGRARERSSTCLSYAPYYEDVIFYGRPEEVEWLRPWRFHID